MRLRLEEILDSIEDAVIILRSAVDRAPDSRLGRVIEVVQQAEILLFGAKTDLCRPGVRPMFFEHAETSKAMESQPRCRSSSAKNQASE
jgi:hypothetical protein